MPRGMHKSGRLRKVFVKTPGAKTKIQYKRRKPARAKCAVYGTPLQAVPRELPAKMANMSKSKKRPERPYGGILSSRAMRELLKHKARTLLQKVKGGD